MLYRDQRLIRYFDWVIPALVSVIALFGLLFIFSATYTAEQPSSSYFLKQILGLICGIGIYLGCCLIDYRTLLRWGYFCYIIVLGLLMFTLVKGVVGMGGQRWISLGFIRVQPSELAKLLFPAFAMHHFFTQKNDLPSFKHTFLPVLCILALSFMLIQKQPDLGTALIVASTGLIMLWLAGLPKQFFIIGGLLVGVGAPLIWHCVLRPYQKNRIAVFLGYGSAQKERYQIEQATIAIGSGGIWGKGLLHGTQNKLKFLPEARTDCIFAVLCEEWGFAGALLLLILFAALFLRMAVDILSLQDKTIQLFAFGTITHIIVSVIVNIGMVLGLLPIVGIPLPLFSYGLSNLWVTCASFGWFSRIIMQQRSFEQYLPTSIR
jgi:rod shape determining protein RodA